MKKVADNDFRPNKEAPTSSVSFRIEAETKDKLQVICEREGVSMSNLIKRLIRECVNGERSVVVRG